MVEYQPAKGEKPEVPGGIGEEDIVYLVLPYIHSAREGVLRLGSLLEQYGTYEMNGIAFQDVNEIWRWLGKTAGKGDIVLFNNPNPRFPDSFRCYLFYRV